MCSPATRCVVWVLPFLPPGLSFLERTKDHGGRKGKREGGREGGREGERERSEGKWEAGKNQNHHQNPDTRLWRCRNKGPLYHGKAMWDTTWGETSVHILMIGGLIISWFLQGIDHIFLGFLFLQAVPEIQRRFWMKPMEHVYLVTGILVCFFPFYSVGVMAWYFPSYLEMLPKPYLQGLCFVANARPSVPDHYATLGVSPDADMKTIKKVFREEAINLHPDKVGDDPVKLARFHAIQTASDALTKGRAEYDKSIENQVRCATSRCAASQNTFSDEEERRCRQFRISA